jgi:hypothetical protein
MLRINRLNVSIVWIAAAPDQPPAHACLDRRRVADQPRLSHPCLDRRHVWINHQYLVLDLLIVATLLTAVSIALQPRTSL